MALEPRPIWWVYRHSPVPRPSLRSTDPTSMPRWCILRTQPGAEPGVGGFLNGAWDLKKLASPRLTAPSAGARLPRQWEDRPSAVRKQRGSHFLARPRSRARLCTGTMSPRLTRAGAGPCKRRNRGSENRDARPSPPCCGRRRAATVRRSSGCTASSVPRSRRSSRGAASSLARPTTTSSRRSSFASGATPNAFATRAPARATSSASLSVWRGSGSASSAASRPRTPRSPAGATATPRATRPRPRSFATRCAVTSARFPTTSVRRSS